MMDSKQWQELFEWAGFERQEFVNAFRSKELPVKNSVCWKKPDSVYLTFELPKQNMNSIFEWIWPKIPTEKRAVIANYLPIYDNPFEFFAQVIYDLVIGEKSVLKNNVCTMDWSLYDKCQENR